MKVSKDCQTTILRRSKRSKISLLERKNSLPIPLDLIIEILSRLPAKSIALCRCVSKLWTYILSLPYFTELFLTRSLARPQLLFISHTNDKLCFFSTPQIPKHFDENSSPVVNHIMHLPYEYSESSYEICGPIRGLVYLLYMPTRNERKEIVQLICNPSTGQVLTLPKVKSRRRYGLKSMFGYDPIDKQYKVLFMTWPVLKKDKANIVFEEHQVLTLGTNKMSWKIIDCSIPHFSISKEICINGVLYYHASDRPSFDTDKIVCFDVRSEKFSFIKSAGFTYSHTLVNYKGKLGTISMEGYHFSGSFQLWVLDDFGKQEWSKHVHLLPPVWKNVDGDEKLDIIGVTSTNEIVLSPSHTCDPLHVFYDNIERESIVRVRIHAGLNVFNPSRIHTFLDHVEDVTRL